MKYIAAYILATMGGKTSPSFSDISAILSSVGIDSDSDRIESLLSSIQNNNIDQLIASGRSKLATVPSVGSTGPISSAPTTASSVAAKKEEKVEAKKEESDDEPMFDLFG